MTGAAVPRSGAFTIVELLAAVTLLSVLAIGVFAWVAAQRSAARWAQLQASQTVAVTAAVRLIRDDLAGGQQADAMAGEQRQLQIMSVHAPPGDRPGLRRITYTINTDGHLLRSARALDGPQVLTTGNDRHVTVDARVVTTHAQGWHFLSDQARGLSLVIARPAAAPEMVLLSGPGTAP